MSRIQIQGVSKHYDDVAVLQGIDLTIPQGSVLALLGPSGCGKTTLLRLIAGFERVDTGWIAFDDRRVAAPGIFVPPERRGIGYVPQEGALFPHLTVMGNVRYGLSRRSNRSARAQEVLALTGLSGLDERYPHELSGGQQQRVALARALAPGPDLILLDEPFNALDLDLRRTMCEDVVDVLRRTGTTTVLVTHDPGEAFAVADLVAVMQGGRIMQCARPDVVYWQPGSPGIARLTGASLFLHGLADGVHAECALGRLPLHQQAAPPTGKVWLALRPEQVQLATIGPGIPALVTHHSFRGDHALLSVEAGDAQLSLRVPVLSAPRAGGRVFLSVHGSCCAFPVHACPALAPTAQGESGEQQGPALHEQIKREQQSEYPYTVPRPVNRYQQAGRERDHARKSDPLPAPLTAIVEPDP
jgi:iron(III) transport system ATP-binding protein